MNNSENSGNNAILGIINVEPDDNGAQQTKLRRRKWLTTILVTIVYVGFIPFLLFVVPNIAGWIIPVGKTTWTAENSLVNEKRIKVLKSEINSLDNRIARLTPGNAYLVINTTENKFSLYRNRKLIREGICSTGSYISLEGEGDQKWVFKTPRGDFKIRGKITDPVWRKPDWAFVEEGLPIPSANDASRYERGVLGDFALALGDGYLIHGTLYQRFLGLPVTHGCIRLADADLKEVYETLPVGAKVFIY